MQVVCLKTYTSNTSMCQAISILILLSIVLRSIRRIKRVFKNNYIKMNKFNFGFYFTGMEWMG